MVPLVYGGLASDGYTTPGRTLLKERGMYSGGRTGGSGWADKGISISCIARINPSAVSYPSGSMSERFHTEVSCACGKLDCIRIVLAWGPVKCPLIALS